MSDGACRCQGCGDVLPRLDAVCARCEAELAAAEPVGRFLCPHCQGRFTQLAQVRWPPHVPWWRPTTMRLQCPHCSTPLRDRYLPSTPGWLVLSAIAGAIASQLFTTGWTRFALGLLCIGAANAPLAWSAWCHRRHRDDAHRYILGLSRSWEQGNDRLRKPG